MKKFLFVILSLALLYTVAVAEGVKARDADADDVSEFSSDSERPWVSEKPLDCRNSMRNPQICRKDGTTYRYRYRSAVRVNGVWYRNSKSSLRWTRGRWQRFSLADRHPTDPRLKRVAGRWVRRSPKKISKYFRVGSIWWKATKNRTEYWWNTRWNVPAWMRHENNPRWRKSRSGKGYVPRRASASDKFYLWQGVWLKAKGSKTAYWNGKWVSLDSVTRNNPNFQRNAQGKWRNVSLRRPTSYKLKYGLWFKPKCVRGKRCVFYNRRWVNYLKLHQNNPNWRFTGNGQWVRTPGASGLYKKVNGWYWRGSLVYFRQRWVTRAVWAAALQRKAARELIGHGGITPGMRVAIRAQVRANFARFIKWFIQNYLRAGNNLRFSKLVSDAAVRRKDAANPTGNVLTPEAPALQGGHEIRDMGSWIVDGKLQNEVPSFKGRRFGLGGGAAASAATPSASTSGAAAASVALGVAEDEDGGGDSEATDDDESEENGSPASDASNENLRDDTSSAQIAIATEGDAQGNGVANLSASQDPSMPSSLGESAVESSSDPSLPAQ